MKRVIDFIVAFFSIILLSPLFVATGFLIWVSDGESVFFCQERIGKLGKKFRIYKFRTMTVLPSSAKKGFDPGNSSRVTPIGRILRKTKLDEVPQLMNVLLGQMSLVGPRPEVEEWVAVYPERWKKVLSVRPGMTDNASILFRNEEQLLAGAANPEEVYRDEILPRKLDLYEEYLSSRSPFKDMSIILRTFITIIKKRSK